MPHHGYRLFRQNGGSKAPLVARAGELVGGGQAQKRDALSEARTMVEVARPEDCRSGGAAAGKRRRWRAKGQKRNSSEHETKE